MRLRSDSILPRTSLVVEVAIGGEPIKYETLHGTSKMALDIMVGMVTRRTELRIKLH